jgi:hypothetical protein
MNDRSRPKAAPETATSANTIRRPIAMSGVSEAASNAAAWADEARRLRVEGERLCTYAGRRFDEANDADEQAEYWRSLVDARERELRALQGGAS